MNLDGIEISLWDQNDPIKNWEARQELNLIMLSPINFTWYSATPEDIELEEGPVAQLDRAPDYGSGG